MAVGERGNAPTLKDPEKYGQIEQNAACHLKASLGIIGVG